MNIRIIPFERLIKQDKNPRGVFAKKWEVCVECNSLEEAEKLKETLAQPKQEPVAWRSWNDKDGYGFWDTKAEANSYCDLDCEAEPLYTIPPQPKKKKNGC